MILNDPSYTYFIFLDGYVERGRYIPQKGHKNVFQIVFNLGFQTPYLLPTPLRPSHHL